MTHLFTLTFQRTTYDTYLVSILANSGDDARVRARAALAFKDKHYNSYAITECIRHEDGVSVEYTGA